MGLHCCEVMVIIFAICWKGLVLIRTNRVIPLTPLLVTILLAIPNQQEKDSSGSSEALCETSFDFTPFYQNYKFIDPRWLEWFIGFVEGELRPRGPEGPLGSPPRPRRAGCPPGRARLRPGDVLGTLILL